MNPIKNRTFGSTRMASKNGYNWLYKCADGSSHSCYRVPGYDLQVQNGTFKSLEKLPTVFLTSPIQTPHCAINIQINPDAINKTPRIFKPR